MFKANSQLNIRFKTQLLNTDNSLHSNSSTAVYICDTESYYSDVFQHPITTQEEQLSVKIDQTVTKNLALCVDLYSVINNEKSTPCNTRIAGSTVNLYDYLKNFNLNDEAELDLFNFSTGAKYGTIHMQISGLNNVKFMNSQGLTVNTANASCIQSKFDGYIAKHMTPFLNRNIKASDSFLYRVHAPVYNTRIMRLPGSAFYLIPERVIQTVDEKWMLQWVEVALNRYNMTKDDFNSTIQKQMKETALIDNFNLCTQVVGMAACTLVHSFDYKGDYIYNKYDRKTAIESFDNIFVTEAGDCEDSSKGIYTIFSLFIKGTYKTKTMRNVQRLATLYVPAGVLGEVNNPSIHTTSSDSKLAHMFAVAIPRHMFYRNSTNSSQNIALYHNFESKLQPLLLEGTGKVLPEVKLNSNFQNTKIIGEGETYIQISNSIPDLFYKKIAHIYTSFGSKNTLSYSIMNEENEYGCEFFKFFNSDFKIKPHEPLTDELLKLCKRIVNLDTPFFFRGKDSENEFVSSKITNVKHNDPQGYSFTNIYSSSDEELKDIETSLIEKKVIFDTVLEFKSKFHVQYKTKVVLQKS